MDKIINSFVYQHVLQDIIDFLASNNYELVAETDVNLIFKTK